MVQLLALTIGGVVIGSLSLYNFFELNKVRLGKPNAAPVLYSNVGMAVAASLLAGILIARGGAMSVVLGVASAGASALAVSNIVAMTRPPTDNLVKRLHMSNLGIGIAGTGVAVLSAFIMYKLK